VRFEKQASGKRLAQICTGDADEERKLEGLSKLHVHRFLISHVYHLLMWQNGLRGATAKHLSEGECGFRENNSTINK
jgi:hypothetical protein